MTWNNKISNKNSFYIYNALIISIIISLMMFIGYHVRDKFNYQAVNVYYQNNHHNNEDLKLVHIIIRHGERTPDSSYPNDIYINHTYYPYGWGQLTNAGRLNQYKTGQFLRLRYGNFLGKLYSSKIVHAQSTDVDRTLMSCSLTMAGLWPTKDTELNWNFLLNWSPVPIRSTPLNDDKLLLPRMDCPRYYEAKESNQVIVEEITKHNSDLYKNLTELTGTPVRTPGDVLSLYGTLRAQENYGLKLPELVKEYYPYKLKPLAEIKYLIDGFNTEMLRLRTGPLLKKIVSDWTYKSQDLLFPNERKLFVYCGHDWMISNILLALGAWDKQIPSYGIMIMLELHKDKINDEYFVEVYLRNSTKFAPTLLKIHGCDERCPLKNLIDLTKHILPENWNEECKSKNPTYIPPPPPLY